MAIHIFGSATHDFYFDDVVLPDELRPLLKTDGQGIVYLSTPQADFFDAIRRGAPLPDIEKLGVAPASFLPLSQAVSKDDFPTGKAANPAALCGLFGLKPTFYCALGEDTYSQQCVSELTAMGVTVKADIIPGMTMAHSHIFIQDTETQLSLIYKGTNNLLRHNVVPEEALDAQTTLLINTSVPLNETRGVLEKAERRKVPRIVFNCTKAAGLTEDDFTVITDIVINRDEAQALASHFKFPFDDENDSSIAAVLARELGVRCVMTRGAKSVIIAHDGMIDEVYPNPVKVVNVTGAGDGFLGAYVAGLEQGKPILQVVREATVVGGLIAAHKGPRRHDISPEQVKHAARAVLAAPAQGWYLAKSLAPRFARA